MVGTHPHEDTVKRVREYAAERHENGGEYLKASQAEEDLDGLSRSVIGMALRAIYDAGEIGAWNLDSDRATTWELDSGENDIGDGTIVPNGLAPTFRALDLNGPCTINDLHDVTGKDPYTLNYHCLELLHAGVVEREKLDDRTSGKVPYEYWVVDNNPSADAKDHSHISDPAPTTTETPWRQRCPKGHASVTVYSDTYGCNACGRSYDGEPFDAKHTEFPVDQEPRPKDFHDEVLAELVRECEDPTTYSMRAHQLSAGSPSQVGRILAELQRDGLVERLGSGGKNGHHWRPTEDGRRQVISTERRAVLEQGRKQRAQVQPVGLWVLAVVLAVLLMAAYALGGGVIVG